MLLRPRSSILPRPDSVRGLRGAALLAFAVLAQIAPARGQTSVNLNPLKDGTLVDGDTYGPRDGVADKADWTFNDTANFLEGMISLTYQESPAEYRVVWEYSLSTVQYRPPVVARLQFTLRPPAVYPVPPFIPVEVVSYPCDLVESLSDFQAGPAELQSIARVVADYPTVPPPTTFRVNVSGVVNKARQVGAPGVAFRFQIENVGSDMGMQAFIKALDSDSTTKPILTLYDRLPGDFDADNAVSLTDAATLASCLAGPEQSPPAGCSLPDDDFDGDIDLTDVAAFQNQFGVTR